VIQRIPLLKDVKIRGAPCPEILRKIQEKLSWDRGETVKKGFSYKGSCLVLEHIGHCYYRIFIFRSNCHRIQGKLLIEGKLSCP
jgi:hypothetical protein